MMHFLRITLVILVTTLQSLVYCADSKSKSAENRVIRPGITLQSETINIGEQTVRYHPTDLEPAAGYELRISFPNTSGVKIILNQLDTPSSSLLKKKRRRRRQSRRLLLAEKIMFHSDKHGHAPDILFQADRWVVWKDNKGPDILYYDAVLERNIGGVPFSAFPIIATIAVVLIVLIMVIVPWWDERMVPRVLRWLGGEERRENKMWERRRS